VQAYGIHTSPANSCGIIQSDIDRIQEGLDIINGKKQIQEGQKLERKLETGQKDTMQVDMEEAIRRISDIGSIVFESEPHIAMLFKDLTKSDKVPAPLKEEIPNISELPEDEPEDEPDNTQNSKAENEKEDTSNAPASPKSKEKSDTPESPNTSNDNPNDQAPAPSDEKEGNDNKNSKE